MEVALHASTTNAENLNSGSSLNCSIHDDPEIFYEKFAEFFDSSGLSLVFNFREAILDLYLFYKEVIQRGGFYEVSKNGKWGEVASALKFKENDSKLCIQLQKLYANLLYRLEMTTAKPETSQRQACSKKLSKNKETKKDPDAPLKKRSAYQLFISRECDRLKNSHKGALNGENIRKLAIQSWSRLSEGDREPYREQSRKDSERFEREMAIYKAHKLECDSQDREGAKRARKSNPSSTCQPMQSSKIDKVDGLTPRRGSDDVYVPVVLAPPANNLANDIKKNEVNDFLSHFDWDGYCGCHST